MKKAITKTLLAGLLGSCSVGFASGFSEGNGGDVVDCESGSPFRVQMLDLYEGKAYDENYQVDLGSADLDLDEKVTYYLEKLKRVAKVRSLRYETEARQFLDKVKWVEGKELTDIPDSGHLVLPVGCKIRQIAIRLPEGSEIDGKRYLVNKDLWGILPTDDKVALIFHEIIYGEALRGDHKNSVQARKLNRWIASSEFSEVDRNEFVKTTIGWDLPVFAQNPHFPDLLFGNTHYDGKLAKGYIAYPSQLDYKGHSIQLLRGARLEFYEDDLSLIRKINLNHDARYRNPRGYGEGSTVKMLGQDYLVEELLTCTGPIHHAELNYCSTVTLFFSRSGEVSFTERAESFRQVSTKERDKTATIRVGPHSLEIDMTRSIIDGRFKKESFGGIVYQYSEFAQREVVEKAHLWGTQRLRINDLEIFATGRILIGNYGTSIKGVVATEGSQVRDKEGKVQIVPHGQCWSLFYDVPQQLRWMSKNSSSSCKFPRYHSNLPNQ